LVAKVRIRHKRPAQPSAAIIDSQSVQTSAGGEARGVDGHKQTPGRKRHIVVVHSASRPAGRGGKLVLQKLCEQIKRNVHNRGWRPKLIGADAAYEESGAFVRKQLGWTIAVVRRLQDQKGFQVLRTRWLVERPCGWVGRDRRLARAYEHTVASSEAVTYLASTRRMLKLLSK
jgi:DDE family transposase